MKYDNFFGKSGDEKYHLSSYFYRIEFQQRGAPHVHSLLWLKNSRGDDAPSFWSEDEELLDEEVQGRNDDKVLEERKQLKILLIIFYLHLLLK